MEYRCISADCHIDLCWLPHDLFVSNASPAMKDRMPYVTQGPNGPKWVTKSGLDIGFANGKGGGEGALGPGRKVAGSKEHRAERMATTGLFADAAQDIFRPASPELRIRDQERDGIQAEVIYGLNGTPADRMAVNMTELEALAEVYRIFNEWFSDFCSYDRKRFVGIAVVPNYNVDVAVAEVRRVAKLGLGGFNFLPYPAMVPISNPYWEPLWKAAAELNLPVHFHTPGPAPDAPLPEDLPRAFKEDLPQPFKVAIEATRRTEAPLAMLIRILAGVIHGGALERYPDLRIVFAESGIGWIPYVLDRMDYEYEDTYKDRLPLKMKPSDYWHRQCRTTFQFDRIGAKLLDDLGIENVMWGSDFPHFDGTFPDSQEYIERQFGQLPSPAKRKIICENVGKLYGLM